MTNSAAEMVQELRFRERQSYLGASFVAEADAAEATLKQRIEELEDGLEDAIQTFANIESCYHGNEVDGTPNAAAMRMMARDARERLRKERGDV